MISLALNIIECRGSVRGCLRIVGGKWIALCKMEDVECNAFGGIEDVGGDFCSGDLIWEGGDDGLEADEIEVKVGEEWSIKLADEIISRLFCSWFFIK